MTHEKARFSPMDLKPLKIETHYNYKVIVNGTFGDFITFFSDPVTDTGVYIDYSPADLSRQVIKEQQFILFLLYGRYLETNVPVSQAESYLSQIYQIEPPDTPF